MPRGYRGIFAALVGVVLATTFGVGLYVGALSGGDDQHERRIGTSANRQNEQGAPQQYETHRAGIPGLAERLISNPEPSTGQDHEKRDLAAQESTSVWTFWMMALAGLGTIITTIATILLYQQIKLTREAAEDTGKATDAMNESNNITRKQMRHELMKTRPVVRIIPGARVTAVDQQSLDGMSEEDCARSCSFSCRIQNTGKLDCWVEDSWIKFEYITRQDESGKNAEYTYFRLGTNIPLSVGEYCDFSDHIYLFPLHIKEKMYNGEGFLRGYLVYRDNDTNTRFGATFGYKLDVIIGGLVAEKRTNERFDWQDGIVNSVTLDRYGHIHFVN